MSQKESQENPRKIVKQRLEDDLGSVEEADVRSAIFCGEMGCGEHEQKYLLQHPDLRCPYMDRVDNPREFCMQLREEYQAATDIG